MRAPRLLSTEPIVDEVLLATLESSCNRWNPKTGERGGQDPPGSFTTSTETSLN